MRHEFRVLFMDNSGEINDLNFRFDWQMVVPEKNQQRKKSEKKKGLNIYVTPLSPGKDQDKGGNQPDNATEQQFPNLNAAGVPNQLGASAEGACPGMGTQEVNMPNNHGTHELVK